MIDARRDGLEGSFAAGAMAGLPADERPSGEVRCVSGTPVRTTAPRTARSLADRDDEVAAYAIELGRSDAQSVGMATEMA